MTGTILGAILDGKALAKRVRARVADEARAAGLAPGLTVVIVADDHHGQPRGQPVVIVGDDPASHVYVRNKTRAASTAGFREATIALPAETAEAHVLEVIARLNADPDVDGILVQLPLPKHIRSQAVIEAIDPAKDVDGLHPVNAGRLASGHPALVPCTPKGVMTMLAEAGVRLAGARALVIGRSSLVGRPVAALLTSADATVTLAHSRTRDLAAECRRAEVLIAAVGRPEMVRGDWVAEGAVVIDVGINRRTDGGLTGDVAFAEARERAAWITPVPGGVGPMTIASLLENTLIAAQARRGAARRGAG